METETIEEVMEKEISRHPKKINQALDCMLEDIQRTDPDRYERALLQLETDDNGKRRRSKGDVEEA